MTAEKNPTEEGGTFSRSIALAFRGPGIFLLVLALLAASGCTGSAPRFAAKSEPGTPSAEPLLLEGTASYYADEFHGRQTSNGETYDMHALTAAHRTLPFNTLLKVTNLGNGKSVVVRVNDRGPFKEGRIVDLSLEAARRLGMMGPGTAMVSLEIVGADPKVE